MRRILIVAAALSVILADRPVSAVAQSDDYQSGYGAGYDTGSASGALFESPSDILPEPLFENPVLRPPDWRQGYRDGYGAAEEQNREQDLITYCETSGVAAPGCPPQ